MRLGGGGGTSVGRRPGEWRLERGGEEEDCREKGEGEGWGEETGIRRRAGEGGGAKEGRERGGSCGGKSGGRGVWGKRGGEEIRRGGGGMRRGGRKGYGRSVWRAEGRVSGCGEVTIGGGEKGKAGRGERVGETGGGGEGGKRTRRRQGGGGGWKRGKVSVVVGEVYG